MPIYYHQHVANETQIAIWEITESEDFFLQTVVPKKKSVHPRVRLQHLAAYYLLSFLLPDFPQENICIATSGKPYLPNNEYFFSISHTNNFAAVIISKVAAVAIDIQMPTTVLLRIQNKFLHTEEQTAFLNAHTTTQHLQVATTLWCAKETAYKWLGKRGVYFKTAIGILPTILTQCGAMQARLTSEGISGILHLHYQWIQSLCMVWTITPKTQLQHSK